MKKKIMSGVVAFGVLPVLVFASTTNISGKHGRTLADGTAQTQSGMMQGSGSMDGHKGCDGMMKGGMMGGMMGQKEGRGERDGFLFGDSKMQAALAASGVVVPTKEELQAYTTTQKAAREAEMKLGDTDKAALKAIRDAAAKQEREYLRSKGITLPTEETIAKMETLQKQAMEVMKAHREEMMKNGKTDTGSGRTMPLPQNTPTTAQ